MKKEKIFKVEGYKRSAGSFKLDLRYACKENPFYFTSVNMFTKNLGQLVFGTPNWKGLFEMEYKEDEDKSEVDIEISLDYRLSLVIEYKEKIKELIQSGLETLKKEGIIKNYEEIV